MYNIVNFTLHLILIIGLTFKVNSGCCNSCKNGGSKKNSKNTTVKEVKITITKDFIEFNGIKFQKVRNIDINGFVANNNSFDSYVFKINDKNLSKSIFINSTITINLDGSLGNIAVEPYIFAAVEKKNGDCYIVYCQDANTKLRFNHFYGFFDSTKNLNKIKIIRSGKLQSSQYMFYECDAKEIDLSGLDTSNVTNMYGMFEKCNRLKSIDLNNLNFSEVTNARYMFYDCRELESIDLSKLGDNKKLLDMSYMFYHCLKLQSVNLGNFEISKEANTNEMFNECRALYTVILDKDKNLHISNTFLSGYNYDPSTKTFTKAE